MIITPSPLKHYKTLQEYYDFAERLKNFKDLQEKTKLNRLLCRTDLFWLLWFGCKRSDVANQWLLDRCKEVEAAPNNHLDLWSRNHYKSTIITFGKSLQDILASHGENPLPEWDREVTIGIFSATRPLAKGFLRQIKQELESNALLKSLFPDILYDKPQSQAPKWSEDEGIIVKRKSNPKEATVEAWGLIDGMPVGKHFFLMVYDDVVTDTNVTTPEMIFKTTEKWELSSNLGTSGGLTRYIGTRYHFNDTYQTMLDKKIATPRIYPCTDDGTAEGKPVLMSVEDLDKKRKLMGEYIFSCQLLLNPTASSLQNFKEGWLKYYGGWSRAYIGNIYIIVDPANSKKKSSDYTVMFVVAACDDQNYYVVDMIRDRMNLRERTDALFKLVKTYNNKGLIRVGYEQYGMQADIEHIREKQDELNYHFSIKELGGKMAKTDRIGKLVPDFEAGKIYIPRQIMKVNYEGRMQNLVDIFIKEEYLTFPTPQHDDMLDALARIKDDELNVSFPLPIADDYDEFDALDNPTRNATTGY
jgi:predicted phage terminase large subunit-like protein